MKTLKVFTSVLLVSCFAIISAGCAGGKSFGPQELAEYAEKQGAEQYKDVDEWCDAFYNLDEDIVDNKDGAYINTKDDIRTAVEPIFDLSVANPNEITCYCIRYHELSCSFTSMAFIDSNSAKLYFETLTDNVQTSNSDLEDYCYNKTESDAKKTISVITCWGDDDLYVCSGYYYNYVEDNILRFNCIGKKKDVVKIVEDLCKEFDLESPTTL